MSTTVDAIETPNASSNSSKRSISIKQACEEVESLLKIMFAFYDDNMIETGYIKDRIPCIEKDLEQIFISSRQLKYTYIDLTLNLGYSEREIE